ncbi:MAG: class I lanthipeptide [Bacteroidetes bacterium]|nr:class I lanthipeptide [Bacteroidota bacterium]MCL2303509.1 class I lanthipeptide [Lentimicrobiaceae bacterium]
MKKLQLNKQTIARLNEPNKIHGGEAHGYKTTVLQVWGVAACVKPTQNYCGIETAQTNCTCYCEWPTYACPTAAR